jgi:hypothetical protein
MNPGDPLAELRDIHLPVSVSAWPLAPGWWLIIVIVCAALAALLLLWSRRHSARLYRRQALIQLQHIEQSTDNQVVALIKLLKQTVNSAYPGQSYSSLGIHEFFEFLRHSCPAALFGKLPENLDHLLYAKDTELDPEVVGTLSLSAKVWIRQHKPSHKLDYQPPC